MRQVRYSLPSPTTITLLTRLGSASLISSSMLVGATFSPPAGMMISLMRPTTLEQLIQYIFTSILSESRFYGFHSECNTQILL